MWIQSQNEVTRKRSHFFRLSSILYQKLKRPAWDVSEKPAPYIGWAHRGYFVRSLGQIRFFIIIVMSQTIWDRKLACIGISNSSPPSLALFFNASAYSHYFSTVWHTHAQACLKVYGGWTLLMSLIHVSEVQWHIAVPPWPSSYPLSTWLPCYCFRYQRNHGCRPNSQDPLSLPAIAPKIDSFCRLPPSMFLLPGLMSSLTHPQPCETFNIFWSIVFCCDIYSTMIMYLYYLILLWHQHASQSCDMFPLWWKLTQQPNSKQQYRRNTTTNRFTTICKTTTQQQMNIANNGCDGKSRHKANLAMAPSSMEKIIKWWAYKLRSVYSLEHMRKRIFGHRL